MFNDCNNCKMAGLLLNHGLDGPKRSTYRLARWVFEFFNYFPKSGQNMKISGRIIHKLSLPRISPGRYF
ncbi:hypothetical protein GWI33_006021 [Rhynchophorus ferrugineus]|uniref:Uncharacterized protein n=1 Tax=Rhynchophorus ferrugineus TaxID=354439 RepID=A0A834J072_RHYFE|nr:hypothetical protein GWI33_006021 [Rhynchophorus ferrugineus]